MSDIRRNIEKLQPSLHFVHWNQQGWKTGLCSVPPIGQVCCLFQIACLSARCFVPPFGKVYLFVFVCLFVFSQSFYTCIPVPHPWRMFVFLKYMPGALPPIGKVYLFVCLFVCLCFLKIHMYTCIPPMEDLLCTLFLFSRRDTCLKLCVDSPQPYSLLTLANNTCFRHTLTDIRERFNKLYRRKVSAWYECEGWECEGVWCEV